MANMIYTARPYMPGQAAVALLGSAFVAIGKTAATVRDAYLAERRAQKLAHATRHLDLHLLRDIGLDDSAS